MIHRASNESESDDENGGRPTVLIIEDHDDTRFVMRAILEQAGFDVVEASNGEEGVAQARECVPDVVVTDLMMPRMDGFGVATALSRAPEGAPPIILASAHAEEGEAQSPLFRDVFDAVVSKPVQPSRLTAAIQAVLDTEPEA